MLDKLATLLAALAISGCAACATPPNNSGEANELGEGTAASQLGSCPDDAPRGPSSDSLGRLVTGAGLCSIEGGWINPRVGHQVLLEFHYDGSGRPSQAISEFAATCGSEGDFGAMGPVSVDDPLCTGYEHHVQRWTWDEQDRLVSVDRTIELDFPAGYAGDEDVACMLDIGPVTVEGANWRYDERGRVRSWDSLYRDCEGTQYVEEQLSYAGATVETHTDIIDPETTTSYTSRSQCDECGRAINEEIVEPGASRTKRYFYDDLGRLIKYEEDESSSSWTYEAAIVAQSNLRWDVEESLDHRTLYLAMDRKDGDRFEIRFDEHQRVISVVSQDEAWVLGYDDCPNAELATTQWQIHEVLLTWPFPRPPRCGDADLGEWRYAQLPLTPEAME